MAKQIILYNLKEGVKEEDYVAWCESFKGPFLLSLKGSRGFTLLKMVGGLTGNGEKGIGPTPTHPPYRYIGILDLDSLEDMERAKQTKEFREGFFRKWFSEWVSDFCTLGGVELYSEEKA